MKIHVQCISCKVYLTFVQGLKPATKETYEHLTNLSHKQDNKEAIATRHSRTNERDNGAHITIHRAIRKKLTVLFSNIMPIEVKMKQ